MLTCVELLINAQLFLILKLTLTITRPCMSLGGKTRVSTICFLAMIQIIAK